MKEVINIQYSYETLRQQKITTPYSWFSGRSIVRYDSSLDFLISVSLKLYCFSYIFFAV